MKGLHVSYHCDKTLGINQLEGNIDFGLVSVLVHDQQALLLLGLWQGRDIMVEGCSGGSCSLHGSQKAKRQMERARGEGP